MKNSLCARALGIAVSTGLALSVILLTGCGSVVTTTTYSGKFAACNGVSRNDLQASYDAVRRAFDRGVSEFVMKDTFSDCNGLESWACKCMLAVIGDVFEETYDYDTPEPDTQPIGGGYTGPGPLAGWSSQTLANLQWTYTPSVGP